MLASLIHNRASMTAGHQWVVECPWGPASKMLVERPDLSSAIKVCLESAGCPLVADEAEDEELLLFVESNEISLYPANEFTWVASVYSVGKLIEFKHKDAKEAIFGLLCMGAVVA